MTETASVEQEEWLLPGMGKMKEVIPFDPSFGTKDSRTSCIQEGP